jgi:hypothetical protein
MLRIWKVEKRPLCTPGGKTHNLNLFIGSPGRLKIELPYDPAIAFLGICPKEC